MLTTLINISWPVAWFGKFSNHLNVFNVWSETTRIFQYQYHKSIPDDDIKHSNTHTHTHIYTYITSKFPYINDTSLKDILIYKQRQLQTHSFQCRMFAFYTNTYLFILVYIYIYIYLLCVKFIYILVYICVNLCLCLWPSLYMVLMNISCFGTFVRI